MSSIRPPCLPLSALQAIVKTYYPFITVREESYKELVGYDDRNYYFRARLLQKPLPVNVEAAASFQKVFVTSPNEYILKVINSRDAVCYEGCSALLHYLVHCGFNCPHPIASVTKQYTIPINKCDYLNLISGKAKLTENEIQEDHYSLLLLTYIPGELLNSIKCKASLQYKLGHYLGSMDKALQNFSHTILNDRKFTDWDLQYLPSLMDRANYIFKGNEAKLFKAQRILMQFKENVTPLITKLRQSIIHGDGNDMNVLMYHCGNGDYEVNGMIDFSDCVKTATIFNLGIAMAYNMQEVLDPVAYIVPLLSGYNAAFPLYQEEWNILYYIILGRLAQSCINGEYHYSQDPSNEYLTISVASGWKLIDQLLSTDKAMCDEIWRHAN